MSDVLTGKQRKFVKAYVVLLNATKAAEEAGYKGGYFQLAQMGHQNLNKPKIKAAINEILEEKVITVAELLTRLSEEASASPAIFFDENMKIKPSAIAKHGHLIKSISVKNGDIKIVMHDAQKAKETIGRYYKLWVDRVESETTILTWTDRIKQSADDGAKD